MAFALCSIIKKQLDERFSSLYKPNLGNDFCLLSSRTYLCISSILFSYIIYSNECNDIDLWPGAHTERPVPGSVVGPLLQCILGRQFQRSKYGDRFWYQNADAGFSEGTCISFNSISDLIVPNKKPLKSRFKRTNTCRTQLH